MHKSVVHWLSTPVSGEYCISPEDTTQAHETLALHLKRMAQAAANKGTQGAALTLIAGPETFALSHAVCTRWRRGWT